MQERGRMPARMTAGARCPPRRYFNQALCGGVCTHRAELRLSAQLLCTKGPACTQQRGDCEHSIAHVAVPGCLDSASTRRQVALIRWGIHRRTFSTRATICFNNSGCEAANDSYVSRILVCRGRNGSV
eukprot:scaffold197909_cov33-Tisochrysis_lutea.AAC.3